MVNLAQNIYFDIPIVSKTSILGGSSVFTSSDERNALLLFLTEDCGSWCTRKLRYLLLLIEMSEL